MSQESIYAQKPWLKHYDPGVPATLEYPRIPLAALLRRAFDQVPDRAALCYMGQQIPYRELDRLSNQMAHVLERSGCRPGDTVGVHLPNVPACYITAIAIQKAGCVFTGVSPLLTPEELAYQLQDSGARALVTPSLYEGFGLPPLEAMACGTPVITSNLSALPEVVGDAGVLVDPKDVDALAVAMWRILSDEPLRASLISKGFKRAAVFSWEKAAQETWALYHSLA